MPEGRLRRARATLPEGYQYGDAGPRRYRFDDFYGFAVPDFTQLVMEHDADGNPFVRVPRDVYDAFTNGWRAPHENAAAQLKKQQHTGEETI